MTVILATDAQISDNSSWIGQGIDQIAIKGMPARWDEIIQKYGVRISSGGYIRRGDCTTVSEQKLDYQDWIPDF
ncbi:hypothetical protein CPT76_10250 [Paenibacillus sp. AR247]|nr:hypothetical protein CPT76_10250 [Paenibacillus sp. AR247]